MSMMLRRHMMIPKAGGDWRDLYQQVAYIDSSDLAYFEFAVPISSSDTFSVQTKFQYLGELTNNIWVAGNGTSQDGAQFEVGYFGSSWYVPNGATAEVNVLSGSGVTALVELQLTRTYSSDVLLTWRMFGRYGFTGANGLFDSRFYFLALKKNGVVCNNLIPCYRKSDNEPGMYDTVSGTFYTNVGTGEFVVGPSITFGKGQYTVGGIADNPNLFMVEIPVDWNSTSRNLIFRWSASGTLGNLGEPGLSAVYMKNANGVRVNYWAGTGEDGYRSVTASASNCASTKTVVFTGYLPDIQSCYVQDATNNIMLWQY